MQGHELSITVPQPSGKQEGNKGKSKATCAIFCHIHSEAFPLRLSSSKFLHVFCFTDIFKVSLFCGIYLSPCYMNKFFVIQEVIQGILFIFRVRDIMEKDSRKDPETEPTALLAKVLVDQVWKTDVPFYHFF